MSDHDTSVDISKYYLFLRPAQVCIEQQCLSHVKDFFCYINGTFQSGQDIFGHYSIANQGVTYVDSSGSAFTGYVPSPLTTHAAYLIFDMLWSH